MQLEHILSRDCTKSAVPCTSKKRALEIISELAAERLGASRQVLFESLLAREKMGSTGIGAGIAIPHGRIDDAFAPTAVSVSMALPKWGAQNASGSSLRATRVSSSMETTAACCGV